VKYETMDEDDHIRVAFEGEIDLESSEEVRRVLVGAVTRSELTVVDLSAVTAIDSSGVAGLLDGHLTAQKRGNKLALSTPSAPVSRVLNLAQLDTVFSFVEPSAEP